MNRLVPLVAIFALVSIQPFAYAATDADVAARASALLEKMTVAEKIGQMSQLNGAGGKLPDGLRETIKRGRVGSILNEVSVDVVNEMQRIAVEVVQLYVRELKGFRRVRLAPGESRTVSFELSAQDLAFYGRDMRPITEPGAFHAWIGGSSDADLRAEFSIIQPTTTSPVLVK